MSSKLRVSDTHYSIMGVLAGRSGLYGLQIVAEDKALNASSIYVHLGRMRANGWVSYVSEHDPNNPGIPRKRYSLTAEGMRVYRSVNAAAVTYAAYAQGVPS